MTCFRPRNQTTGLRLGDSSDPMFPNPKRKEENFPSGFGFQGPRLRRWMGRIVAFILVGSVQVIGGPMELAEFFKACRFAAVPLQ